MAKNNYTDPRKYLISIFTFLIFSAAILISGDVNADLRDTTSNVRLINLKSEIQKVVIKHKNLAAGIALVIDNKPIWIGGVGEDRPEHPVSENTMFRTASVSKMLVALAILKLQEQAKLKLDDKIKDIVPEVRFDNRWEETEPVRIVHLLEHTTGWDEIHLVEMMHNQKRPLSLKQALEFHPHSRKSRWQPGTRMAYCNSAYTVAAYIVEKVSGMPYEVYVRNAIFRPLKMNHSSFFNDPLFQQWGAKTFNWAMQAVDYKEELYRPAAGLNSSADDMAKILIMLLNKGQGIDSLQFLKKASIKRMESPKSTPGAIYGLEQGYGLANRTSYKDSFTYYGHDGAIDGGLSELAYLPNQGIGHVILLNANNGPAMQEISALIKNFETEGLQALNDVKSKYKGQIEIDEGYYVAINPRSQNRFYQDLILSIEHVKVFKDKVTMSWIIPGQTKTYYPVSSKQFTYGITDKIGLVEAIDPLEGKVLYSDTVVLRPISAVRVFSQIFILVIWIVFMLLGTLTTLGLLLLRLVNRTKKHSSALKLMLLPAFTSLSIISIMILSRIPINNADVLLSRISTLSVSLLILSILFALGAACSLFTVLTSNKNLTSKTLFGFALVLSFLHVLLAIYLIVLKVIPIVSWS